TGADTRGRLPGRPSPAAFHRPREARPRAGAPGAPHGSGTAPAAAAHAGRSGTDSYPDGARPALRHGRTAPGPSRTPDRASGRCRHGCPKGPPAAPSPPTPPGSLSTATPAPAAAGTARYRAWRPFPLRVELVAIVRPTHAKPGRTSTFIPSWTGCRTRS